jgi:hypothetical protein
MVKSVPHVNVTHEYGIVNRVLSTDNTLACVMETKKGIPNVPILITSPGQLRLEFGVEMNAYWAAGGGPFWGVRAAYGDVTAAIHYIMYEEATPTHKMAKIVSKKPGSNRMFITFRREGTGIAQRLSLTIEEEDGITEYFLNVKRAATQRINENLETENRYKSAFQNLVEKVNSQSRLVEMFFLAVDDEDAEEDLTYYPAEPEWVQELTAGEDVFVSGKLFAEIPRSVLGGIGEEGDVNVPGNDGTHLKDEADQKLFDIISDEVMDDGVDAGMAASEAAHAEALKSLEQLPIAGVFSLKSIAYESRFDVESIDGLGDIYQPYLDHVVKMATPEQHGWRFAIVGADENMNMLERIKYAASMNNELMIFVAGGLVDVNGVEYEPRLATMAVAGKISETTYNLAIWGGKATKALRTSGKNFIVDILPIPGEPIYDDPDAENPEIIGEEPVTRSEMIEYNECGCLTFLKDGDGIKITEGVTTVQESYAELGIRKEDEIAVMRVVNHAKYQVYDACYGMLGQGLTDTFKTDLEEAVRQRLSVMSEEGAISNFEVAATVGPNIQGEQGQIQVDIAITPVHAARIIDARIVVY